MKQIEKHCPLKFNAECQKIEQRERHSAMYLDGLPRSRRWHRKPTKSSLLQNPEPRRSNEFRAWERWMTFVGIKCQLKTNLSTEVQFQLNEKDVEILLKREIWLVVWSRRWDVQQFIQTVYKNKTVLLS